MRHGWFWNPGARNWTCGNDFETIGEEIASRNRCSGCGLEIKEAEFEAAFPEKMINPVDDDLDRICSKIHGVPYKPLINSVTKAKVQNFVEKMLLNNTGRHELKIKLEDFLKAMGRDELRPWINELIQEHYTRLGVIYFRDVGIFKSMDEWSNDLINEEKADRRRYIMLNFPPETINRTAEITLYRDLPHEIREIQKISHLVGDTESERDLKYSLGEGWHYFPRDRTCKITYTKDEFPNGEQIRMAVHGIGLSSATATFNAGISHGHTIYAQPASVILAPVQLSGSQLDHLEQQFVSNYYGTINENSQAILQGGIDWTEMSGTGSVPSGLKQKEKKDNTIKPVRRRKFNL